MFRSFFFLEKKNLILYRPIESIFKHILKNSSSIQHIIMIRKSGHRVCVSSNYCCCFSNPELKKINWSNSLLKKKKKSNRFLLSESPLGWFPNWGHTSIQLSVFLSDLNTPQSPLSCLLAFKSNFKGVWFILLSLILPQNWEQAIFWVWSLESPWQLVRWGHITVPISLRGMRMKWEGAKLYLSHRKTQTL